MHNYTHFTMVTNCIRFNSDELTFIRYLDVYNINEYNNEVACNEKERKMHLNTYTTLCPIQRTLSAFHSTTFLYIYCFYAVVVVALHRRATKMINRKLVFISFLCVAVSGFNQPMWKRKLTIQYNYLYHWWMTAGYCAYNIIIIISMKITKKTNSFDTDRHSHTIQPKKKKNVACSCFINNDLVYKTNSDINWRTQKHSTAKVIFQYFFYSALFYLCLTAWLVRISGDRHRFICMLFSTQITSAKLICFLAVDVKTTAID